MKLRVLLDGTGIRCGGKGVSRFQGELFHRLIDSDTRLDYVCALTQDGELLSGIESDRVVPVSITSQIRWAQYELPALARRLGADIIYTTAEFTSLWGPRTVSHIFEIPDVRAGLNQESVLRDRLSKHVATRIFPRSLHRAAEIVTSTKVIAEQLAQQFGLNVEQIHVVPLGVSPELFFPAGLPRSILFHLGSSDPRDGTLLVCEAYIRARRMRSDMPRLVVAGDLGDVMAPSLCSRSSCLLSSAVTFVGRVDDDRLREFYSSARLCIQPSAYEGFGLQPLEAIACGAPTLVFNDPSVIEVLGDAAITMTSRDPDVMAREILRALDDPHGCHRATLLGLDRVREFSWDTTARMISNVLFHVSQS